MFQTSTPDIIEDLIEEIYDKGIVLSNYYNLNLEDVSFYKTEFSIVIKKSFDTFSRIYFMTHDIEDLKQVLSSIEGAQVINFPTVQDNSIINNLMHSCGYTSYKVYEIYSNNFNKGNDTFVDQFATEKDLDRVKFLLYKELDVYSDHLPNDHDLLEMIRNKQVLVNYEDEKICGVFIFSIQGKKCYFNFWVDTSKNGLFLLFNMHNYLKLKEITYSYLWVNTQNEKVIKIHKLFGCKPNGSMDYIYTKNINNN